MSFVRACSLGEIRDGKPLAVRVADEDVALVRVGEDVYAIQDLCSHAHIALSEGDLDGCEVECWLHGSRFDVRTGKPLGPPATEPVPVYPVQVDGDDVLVDVTNPFGG